MSPMMILLLREALLLDLVVVSSTKPITKQHDDDDGANITNWCALNEAPDHQPILTYIICWLCWTYELGGELCNERKKRKKKIN